MFFVLLKSLDESTGKEVDTVAGKYRDSGCQREVKL
jgi:hypothetical protein